MARSVHAGPVSGWVDGRSGVRVFNGCVIIKNLIYCVYGTNFLLTLVPAFSPAPISPSQNKNCMWLSPRQWFIPYMQYSIVRQPLILSFQRTIFKLACLLPAQSVVFTRHKQIRTWLCDCPWPRVTACGSLCESFEHNHS